MISLNDYIERIENNDFTLTEIDLDSRELNDDDAESLMQALFNNPEVAQGITILSLSDNQLTSINILATLTALQELGLGDNQLTDIAIPTTLRALTDLDLFENRLTIVDIPQTLIALKTLLLNDNRLTDITIPATLRALNHLRLSRNQLTRIDIPVELIALQELDLENNQLTSINIPATLIALQALSLYSNQLTSINIPATLIALQALNLYSNQLTRATKLALAEFALTRPRLIISGLDDIPAQLTPEILQEHFEAMSGVFLANIKSSLFFKDAVRNLLNRCKPEAWYLTLSPEIISTTLNTGGIDSEALLNQNIDMFRIAYFSNRQQLNLLNSCFNAFKDDIIITQQKEVKSIINQCKKDYFLAIQNALRDTACITESIEIEETSGDLVSQSQDKIDKIGQINEYIYQILFIQKFNPTFKLEDHMQYLLFGHPCFSQSGSLMNIVQNIKTESWFYVSIIPDNQAEAAKYYKLFADQGITEAQYSYALCVGNGDGIAIDKTAAAKYCKLAADQGLATAQYRYALCVGNGDGIAIDKTAAAKYCKLAADQGLATAQLRYAFCVNHGYGIAIDKTAAATYCKLAADQGVKEAQCLYAKQCMQGTGITVNKAEAATYFKLAADQGVKEAQFLYAKQCMQGTGIIVNKAEAATYFKLAADQGVKEAQYEYAICAMLGEGMSINQDEAAKYHKLAAENGEVLVEESCEAMFKPTNKRLCQS
jgi:TPR repeat protein